MTVAGKKLAAPRVTVTHERDPPIKASWLHDPMQSALGNGVANALKAKDEKTKDGSSKKVEPTPPVQFIEFEPDIGAASPVKTIDEAAATKKKTASPVDLQHGGGEVGTQVLQGPKSDQAIKGLSPGVGTPMASDTEGEGPLAKLAQKDGATEEADIGGDKVNADKTENGPASDKSDEDQAAPEPTTDEDEFAAAGDAEGGTDKQASDKATPVEAETSGGSSSDLAAWKGRVSGAIAATPQPSMGDEPAAKVTVIAGTGKAASAKYRSGVGRAAEDVKKAVRPPPQTPKPIPPPPPTPVPEADRAIANASDKKLPAQVLPELVPLPHSTVPDKSITPVMDLQFAGDFGSQIGLPPEPVAAPAADGKSSKEGDQLDKLKSAKAKEAEPRKATSGQKMTLEDTTPPPQPRIETGTKGQSKEKVAQVLAELLRDPGPEGEADKIVSEARKEAYPREAVQMEYPDLGTDKKADVQAELKAQVDAIRAIAGVTQVELDAAIKTREATLQAMKDGVKVQLEKSATDAKADTKKGGEEAAADIWAAREAQDKDILDKAIAANGEADPTVIEMRRDKGVRDLTQRAARQDIYYEKSGERRMEALGTSQRKMSDAYKTAALGHKAEIVKRLQGERPKGKTQTAEEAKQEATALDTKAEAEAKPTFEAAARQSLALGEQFAELKSQVTTTIKSYREGIKSALSTAKSMLSDWADEKIADQESWWESLSRAFREWMKDAQSDSAAWEEARNEQLRDALVGDLQMIDDLEAAAQEGANVNALVQARGLDAAQATVLQTYYTPVGPEGKGQRDAIGAVAAGMRMRINVARKPGLLTWFKDEVLKRPDGEWAQLARIGSAEKAPFNVAALGSKIFHAVDQWGTDEDAIFEALAGLTPVQAKALRAFYQQTYKRSLDRDLDEELSGAEYTRAKAQLEGNQVVADVATLREAMHGGLTGAGTDEDAIMRVLRNKTPEEQAAIKAEYKRLYGDDLDADLKSELDDGFSSHHDLDRAKALQAGDVRMADAIALDASMHGGLGTGTDEGEITRIYEQNRAEVEDEASRKGWDTKRMNEEIARRNKAIEDSYESKYGDPGKTEGPSALRKAFGEELSEAELDLANALADADMTKIDIAKLGVEKQSFITSNDTVNTILESQGKRARKDVERDVHADMQFRAEADTMRGKPWGPDQWRSERKAAQDSIESETKKRAMQYMGALEKGYDSTYGGGTGGLTALIVFNMSGYDQQKAFDLKKQGGILEPEQEVYYAVSGVGTDMDKLKGALKGKSKEEIARMRKAWVARYGGKESDFDAAIFDDVGGRDTQDMKWALEGEPQTPEEKKKRAKERMDYEKTSIGFWGSYEREDAFIEQQYLSVVAEIDRVEALKDLNKPKAEGESEDNYQTRIAKYSYWEDSLKLREGYFDVAIEDHRKAVDSFADTAATIAGIVAVVVVMAVVAFFTAGTGAVAIGAALASAKVAAAAAIAAAAATMITKQAIKGSTYSGEDMAIDAIVGAVDAVASAMTAGVGGGLLKAARAGAPASKLAGLAAKSKLANGLAKMATSERMAARVLAGAVSEGVEGVVSTMPSALMGNVLDEKNWVHGNPLGNIIQGTVIQTGMGAVISGGMGGLGGIAKHVPDPPPVRETGDILAKRGTVTDRAAQLKAWKIENPGRSTKEFLAQFDAGVLAKESDAAAQHAIQRQMRGELLSAIPPSQRGEFATVPIHVLSDADFGKLTRSASGQAVIMFKDGKPMVVLREGADIKALREEGIHLVQSKDPKLAHKFKALDETNLANWNKMGLDEQLALYRTKLDVELDGQARLIKSIDEQLAGANDPALRKALLTQRKAAEQTLGNLRKRMGEVGDIGPLEQMKMARGEVAKPQYLDQEPRLFSKKSTPSQLPDVEAPPKMKAAAVNDSGVAERAGRYVDGLRLERDGTGQIPGDLSSVFKVVIGEYLNRGRKFVNDTIDKMARTGKSFNEIMEENYKAALAAARAGVPPRFLFDATVGIKSFVDAFKTVIADGADTIRIGGFLNGIDQLINKSKLDISIVDPFVKLAAIVSSPSKLLNFVDFTASLPSFRYNRLTGIAEIIEMAATRGKAEADAMIDELEKLAILTQKRDGLIDDDALWDAANQEIRDHMDMIVKDARYSGVKDKLELKLQEFSRTKAFNWDDFKTSLSSKYDIKSSEFPKMKDVIDNARAYATAHKKPLSDADLGPILHWGKLAGFLYNDMPAAKQPGFVMKIADVLKKYLPGGLKTGGYKEYRNKLAEAVIGHILTEGTPAQQIGQLRKFMNFLRKDMKADPASIGEYFATFRRALFENSNAKDMQGPLSGAKLVDINRSLDGSKRMVDGALKVDIESAIPHGPQTPGLYLLEDKAGKSFDLDQAINYSNRLDAGTLQPKNADAAKGLIYIVEDPLHAESIASQIVGLNPGILIATFGSDGKLKFVPRPFGPVPLR